MLSGLDQIGAAERPQREFPSIGGGFDYYWLGNAGHRGNVG